MPEPFSNTNSLYFSRYPFIKSYCTATVLAVQSSTCQGRQLSPILLWSPSAVSCTRRLCLYPRLPPDLVVPVPQASTLQSLKLSSFFAPLSASSLLHPTILSAAWERGHRTTHNSDQMGCGQWRKRDNEERMETKQWWRKHGEERRTNMKRSFFVYFVINFIQWKNVSNCILICISLVFCITFSVTDFPLLSCSFPLCFHNFRYTGHKGE